MEDLTANIPAWGMFALAAIYVVVKLSYEFVDRSHKRALEAGKRKPRPTPNKFLPAFNSDLTGKHAIDQALEEREEKARSQEMHALLKKQDELIAQLAQSDKTHEALLEHLVVGQQQHQKILAQVVQVLEGQNTSLAKIGKRQLDASRSWDTLRASIDRFAKVVEHDSSPPAPISAIGDAKKKERG